jgi:glutaminase
MILGLESIYKKVKKLKGGKNASYIPELKKVDPKIYGISICMADGTMYQVGDYKKEVSLQSVSKVFTLALVLKKKGLKVVREKIGSQGSFLPFDSIIAAEISETKTLNPFVNAGAMATTSLCNNWKEVSNNMNLFAGRKLRFSKRIYNSESKHNEHNKALAYLLKSHDKFYGDIDKSIDTYTKQGAVMATSKDVAVMAATLANNGINPLTKKKVIGSKYVPYILGQMFGGGMYEYSDTWVIDVGVPSKSGVGGVIMSVVPGVMGIAVVSPPLDKYGNSFKGIKTMEKLSKLFELNIMASAVSLDTLKVL